jgi:hypothetical protein
MAGEAVWLTNSIIRLEKVASPPYANSQDDFDGTHHTYKPSLSPTATDLFLL